MTASTRFSQVVIALLFLTSLFIAPSLRAQEAGADPQAAKTTNSRLPEPIRALLPAVVSLTHIEAAGEDVSNERLWHAGVVVDPRGYIVVPLMPSESRPKLFLVRLADQQEMVGQLAAIDESLKLGVVKIERPQTFAAVSFAKSREARVDDRVLLVPSPRSKELRSGQVSSTTETLDQTGSSKLIQSSITFSLTEYGSLMVSEAGEPIGIAMASRTEPQPTSFALPAKAVLPLVQAAIDKPKDVPLVTVAPSSPAIDLTKPVQLSLQPATSEAKSLVEGFAKRGAKVLDYEEGKRLKIEAPPVVLDELAKQFAQVAKDQQKPKDKAIQPTDAPADFSKPKQADTPAERQPNSEATLGSPPSDKPTKKVADEIPAGMMVVKVPIDPAKAAEIISIRPGERVDVRLTSSRLAGSAGGSKPIQEDSTVLENVMVFAVETAHTTDSLIVKNVSLLVTPDQSQQLKQASGKGTIHLAKVAAVKLPEIVGTWRRAESETISLFTIWPVENDASLIFIEGPDGNGLLERKHVSFAPLIFQGFFTFKLLGYRTAQIALHESSDKAIQLVITPFDDQRKQLLRNGFAKTERELNQKLASTWTRVESPAQPKPVPTVTVVKTEIEPTRVRELLHDKFRGEPYRFFSNDTFSSVIVVAPAEVQEEIEAVLHKLDDPATHPSNYQTAPGAAGSTKKTDAQIPDITGRWRYTKHNEPGDALDGELQIRRMKDDPSVFSAQRIPSFSPPLPAYSLKWRPDLQKFQVIPTNPSLVDAGVELALETFQLSVNQQSIRHGATLTEMGLQDARKRGLSESQIENQHNAGSVVLTRLGAFEDEPTVKSVTNDSPQKNDVIKVFTLENASAVECAKWLKDLAPSANIRAQERENVVFISAPAEKMLAIEAILRRLDEAPTKPAQAHSDLNQGTSKQGTPVEQPGQTTVKVFKLANGSAVEISKLLKGLAPSAKIVADEQTNSLIVSASTEQLLAVEASLLVFDKAHSTPTQDKSDLNRGAIMQGSPIGLPGPPHLPYGSGTGLKRGAGKAFSPSPEKKFEGLLALPDSAEARKLADTIAEHEAKARLLADEIRSLSKQLGPNHPKLIEVQRKLEDTLADTLAAKLKLEQLQITSLEERLTQLKTQIGQRKVLREKIIARRARELIDGNETQWNEVPNRASNATSSPQPARDLEPKSKSLVSEKAIQLQREVVQQSFELLKSGKIAISDALRACQDLGVISPGDAQEHLKELLEHTETGFNHGIVSQFDLKSVQAAFEKARLLSDGTSITNERSEVSDPQRDLRQAPSDAQSYQELAKKLGTIDSSVTEAEEDLKLAQQRVEAKLEPNESVTKARRQLNEAIRNQKAIQDEYAAVLRDLELQIESAKVEADTAKQQAERVTMAIEKGAIPKQMLDEYQPRMKQSSLALERLQVRYDLYKKAGAAVELSNLKLTPIQASPNSLTAEEKEKQIWEQLGLKFGKELNSNQVPTPYRGGLTITDVEWTRFTPVAIQKGDTLVGLHQWETTSLDGILEMLRNAQSMSVGAGVNFRVIAIRDQNVIKTGVTFYSSHFKNTATPTPPRPPASIEDLLQSLKDNHHEDHVSSVMSELSTRDLGEHAGRVATAVLAAMEFQNPLTCSHEELQRVTNQAKQVLISKVARSARVPIIIQTLKEDHPQAQMVAVWSLNDDGPLWEYANEPGFATLAELLLAMASEPDMILRGTALNFLATTLPISKINLDDLSTEERRESLRRFSKAFPREKVEKLITDAASDKNIDFALNACRLLRAMPEKVKEPTLANQLAQSLTQIIEGKFHDLAATKQQRGEAIGHLAMLRERAAPAVPVLIELLKAKDMEDGLPKNGERRSFSGDFTRMKVLLTLASIGPSAKDALPILEEELAAIEKKEREDALLAGKPEPTKGFRSPTNFDKMSRTLRMAIGAIKGETQFRGF